jgi:SAM-dependent methyltransferase
LNIISSAIGRLRRRSFDARRYWEERYRAEGTSGDGSVGRLAEFKARVMNDLISKRRLESAIEFGCGDGDQLSLISYADYLGLDVSPTVVRRCSARFAGDSTKRFLVYDPFAWDSDERRCAADVSVSLDVIYHLVDDIQFELYMKHLCDSARRCVVIYSTDADKYDSQHVRHRKFTDWIASNRGDMNLDSAIENPYPGTGIQESMASFFIYSRTTGCEGERA